MPTPHHDEDLSRADTLPAPESRPPEPSTVRWRTDTRDASLASAEIDRWLAGEDLTP